MAKGEIDIFGKLVARTADGKIVDAAQVDGLEEAIAGSIRPQEKEVINVLTASEEPPAQAEVGDLYIDTLQNILVKYKGDEWSDLVIPQTDVVYITMDTSHIYVWNGEEFVDKTNEEVDNTIYVNSINPVYVDYEMPDGTMVKRLVSPDGLWDLTDAGLRTVCVSGHNWYTLVVSVSRRTGVGRPPRVVVYYNQTLKDENGYMTRTRINDGEWSEWVLFTYASQQYVAQELANLRPDHGLDTEALTGKIVLTKGEDSYAISAEKIEAPAAPSLPGSTTYTGSKTINITGIPSGATVRWTDNGNDPSATSGNTSTSITLQQENSGSAKEKNFIIKAVAVKYGMISSVVSRNYTINRQLAAPTISNPGGSKYDSSRSVTITNNAVGGVRGTLKYKIANGEWITPTLTDNAVTISATGDVTAVVELDIWESNTATKSVPVGAKKCYIGRTTGSSVNDLSALLNRKDINADTLAGREEENNFSAAGYVWFIVPSGQTITKVTSSGFDVPVELVANQISGYNCYRGVEDYVAGTFTFKFV